MLDKGYTLTLAEHVAKTKFDHLPVEVIKQFERTLLDYLTAATTGVMTKVSQQILRYLEEEDLTRDAVVIGTKSRLSVLNAALVNGASAHGLDFDDGHTQASAHPAAAIFSAVLAVAEQKKASPSQVVLATVLGYDIMLRISSAIHPSSVNRGFHNTPVAGVMGAAAGVSSLIGLNENQTLHALGLAGSFAGGLFEFLAEGAEIKRIHPGKAARDGILCAEFAKRGITGPTRVLEGRNGFMRAFAGMEVNWERLVYGLGERYEISDTYFKPYPCCRHIHAVIDGVRDLKVKHGIKADEVDGIDVGLYLVGSRHNHKNCDNLLDAQMSIPCSAALALVFGELTTRTFDTENVQRQDVRQLIDHVNVFVDDECEQIYPRQRSAVVTVRMKNGESHTARIVDPKGEGGNPLTDKDLEQKFLVNCQPILGQEKCTKVLHAVWQFKKLPDLSEFYCWGS